MKIPVKPIAVIVIIAVIVVAALILSDASSPWDGSGYNGLSYQLYNDGSAVGDKHYQSWIPIGFHGDEGQEVDSIVVTGYWVADGGSEVSLTFSYCEGNDPYETLETYSSPLLNGSKSFTVVFANLFPGLTTAREFDIDFKIVFKLYDSSGSEIDARYGICSVRLGWSPDIEGHFTNWGVVI